MPNSCVSFFFLILLIVASSGLCYVLGESLPALFWMKMGGQCIHTKTMVEGGGSNISFTESSERDGFLSIQLNLEAVAPVFDFLLLGF